MCCDGGKKNRTTRSGRSKNKKAIVIKTSSKRTVNPRQAVRRQKRSA